MVFITILLSKGKMSVWVCGVSISRVFVVCYSTHHRVMSQARDDFEGFFRAHMTEDEKVIAVFEDYLDQFIARTSPPRISFSGNLSPLKSQKSAWTLALIGSDGLPKKANSRVEIWNGSKKVTSVVEVAGQYFLYLICVFKI